MVLKPTRAQKKSQYDQKLCRLLGEYSQVLIVGADNVGSNQLQNIRQGLRGDSIVLMGKNTMMKRSIRMHSEKTGNTAVMNLVPHLVGNVGLIFTKGDLKEVKEEVAKYKVGAPARVGLVAPIDVIVPPGNTGLDPSQTSFFQVLNIPTKINKGTVEIITPVELIKKGDKVGSSEAALLSKLGIRPFSYGLIVLSVYDNGSVFSPEVLDLTEDDLLEKFLTGVSMVASVSLALSFPTIHSWTPSSNPPFSDQSSSRGFCLSAPSTTTAVLRTEMSQLPQPQARPNEAGGFLCKAHQALQRGQAAALGEMGGGDSPPEEPDSPLARHLDTAEEAALAYDKAAFKLRGDSARLNFPHLKHQGSCIEGEFGEYRPLHSSVDAKLQAICDNMAKKQGNSKKKPVSAAKKAETATAKLENSSSLAVTESDGSAASSPLSDLTFPDFTELPWDQNQAWDNSMLEKYPSEIDWASLLP